VAANRAGHDGHGLARLSGYARRLRAGGTVSGPWRLERAEGRSSATTAVTASVTSTSPPRWRGPSSSAASMASPPWASPPRTTRAPRPARARRGRRRARRLLVTNAPAVLARQADSDPWSAPTRSPSRRRSPTGRRSWPTCRRHRSVAGGSCCRTARRTARAGLGGRCIGRAHRGRARRPRRHARPTRRSEGLRLALAVEV
jgi:hypothetical protein